MVLKVKLRGWELLVIALVLALGLAADVRTDVIGQAALGAGVWVAMFVVLARFAAPERHVFLACLAIATAGELFLSLVWGLYTYRLGNIAPFVPPGHVLLFIVGLWLSDRISDRAARVVFGCAGLYAAVVAAVGLDTFAPLLFAVIAAGWFALPGHRRLYASTFVLSLTLEVYGTWLGVWTWALQVPATGLVTTNPPGIASAFYCALDALVITAALTALAPRKTSAAAIKAA